MKNINFKWKHYQPEISTLCCCWYLKYPIRYRNLEDMMGFKFLKLASKTIQGIEAMNMIRKGQVNSNKSVLFEVEFINQLFAT